MTGYQELPECDGAEVRHGTMLSTALLFATSGMGAGMLTLPYTVQQAGPATGLCLMTFGALLSAVSTVILAKGAAELKADTYGKVIERALKSHVRICGISVVDAAFFVYLMFGIIAAYLIFIADFLRPLISLVFGESCTPAMIIYAITLFVIAPLACGDEMNGMKEAAQFSVLAVLFTCAVVVVKSWFMMDVHGGDMARAVAMPVSFNWVSFKAFGSMIFAFDIGSCVPAIATEVKKPTMGTMIKATSLGFCFVFVLYFTLAFAVYFAFEGHCTASGACGTMSDFTQNYPKTDVWMTACRCVLTWTFLCTTILICVPAMKCLYTCAGQAMGDPSWAPTGRQRVVATYAALIPSALLAAHSHEIGEFVSILGSIGGCPEILAGPLVLVLTKQVCPSMNWLLRVLCVTFSAALMMLLWSSSFVSAA